MARVELPITVINSTTGLPVAGAAVAPSYRSSGAPAPWWPSETGGTSSTSAIITDAAGRTNAWFERGAYNLSVTGTGITGYTEPWDAIPATDASLDMALVGDGTIPLAKLVAAVQQALVPTGTVLPFAGSTAPTGYFVCDGQPISRTTYATLFTAIGTTYGVGDGATTFNVPNLRGRVPVGRDATDTAFDVLGEVGGEKTHLLTAAESGLPSHAHTDTFAISSVQPWTTGWNAPIANTSWIETAMQTGTGISVYNLATGGPNVFADDATISYASGAHSHPITGAVSSVAAAAASTAHNNVQPYQVLNFIIKAT